MKKFSEMTKREKILLVFAGGLISFLFIYFLVFDTLNSYIAELDKKLLEAKTKRDEASFRLSLLKKFSRSMGEYKELQNTLKNNVFNGTRNKALKLLADVFTKNKIEANFSASTKNTGNFAIYTFKSKFNAKETNFYNTLRELEYYHKIIIISDLNIRVASEKLIRVLMTIRIPSEKQKQNQRWRLE
jgi:hypothetical protein